VDATWTLPTANRSFAPGWQPAVPQVFARLAREIRDAGFEDGRMSWTPWQLAQLATSTTPPRAARPWKLSANVWARSLGSSHFSVTFTEA
jgi:hypothetical protein